MCYRVSIFTSVHGLIWHNLTFTRFFLHIISHKLWKRNKGLTVMCKLNTSSTAQALFLLQHSITFTDGWRWFRSYFQELCSSLFAGCPRVWMCIFHFRVWLSLPPPRSVNVVLNIIERPFIIGKVLCHFVSAYIFCFLFGYCGWDTKPISKNYSAITITKTNVCPFRMLHTKQWILSSFNGLLDMIKLPKNFFSFINATAK